MFLTLLMLFVGPWTLAISSEPALDSLWQEAVGLYKLEKYAEACQKFEAWKSEAKARGIDSKDVYANLTLCYSKESRWDHSVSSLLSLAQRESLPWAKWYDLGQIQRMQEHLGIQDNPTTDLGVQLKLLFSSQHLLLALSFSFWLLTFPAIRLFIFRKRWDALHWTLLGVSAAFMLTSGSLLAGRKLVGNLAVLTSEEADVSVYEKAVENHEQRLVQLPRGAVVLTGRSANGLIQIQAPLVGWVKSEQVASLY